MNKHEVTELCVRLIAILNLTNLLSTLPYLLSIKDVVIDSDAVRVSSPWIVPLIIFDLLISIFLWFGATSIAQRMWRGSKESSAGTSLTTTQLQTILFSAIGLYLLVSVMPNVFEFFTYFGQKLTAGSQLISLSDFANAVGFLLRVLISAWLLFNPSSIVSTLHRGKSVPK